MVNLSSFLRYHAAQTPDRLALVFGATRLTYSDLWEKVQAAAGYLHDQGVSEGQTVAVFMKNSPAFIELAFAASYLGTVFLPINFRLAADEVAFITDDAQAVILFGDDEFKDVLKDIANVHLLDETAQNDLRVMTGPRSDIPAECVKNPGDLFRLMYTSGTTDRPKGVMHSYENFYWKSMEHVVTLGLTRDTRLLVTGPLYHVGAFDLPGVAIFWLGGMMYLHRDFEPEAAVQSIQDEKLTGAWLAPIMLSGILALPNRADYDVSSIEWIIGGGDRTPEQRIREFGDYFTKGRYIDAYGLTESVSGDSFMQAGREIEKIGSVGVATPHVQIRIMDDDGNILPSGTEGEICLSGPKIAKGYWNAPEKTAETRHGDWFRTGDVGYLDEEGFLYLTDRKKDLIISGGENIASSEVERVIYLLPQISEVAVIGVPDEKWGERPIAIAALKDGETLTKDAFRDHCRAHLASFKVPKDLVLCEALPRNPSGKILKRVLRDEFGAT